MITLKGSRHISMSVKIVGIAPCGSVCVLQTIASEGEILKQNERLLAPGETLMQNYSLDFTDEPLTPLDKLLQGKREMLGKK